MSLALAGPEVVSVPAALAVADDAIAAAGEAVWRMSEAELRAGVADCAALVSRVQGPLLRLVSEAEARGVPGQDGASGTAAWLRVGLRATRATPRQLAETAAAVRGSLSATGAACPKDSSTWPRPPPSARPWAPCPTTSGHPCGVAWRPI